MGGSLEVIKFWHWYESG